MAKIDLLPVFKRTFWSINTTKSFDIHQSWEVPDWETFFRACAFRLTGCVVMTQRENNAYAKLDIDMVSFFQFQIWPPSGGFLRSSAGSVPLGLRSRKRFSMDRSPVARSAPATFSWATARTIARIEDSRKRLKRTVYSRFVFTSSRHSWLLHRLRCNNREHDQQRWPSVQVFHTAVGRTPGGVVRIPTKG